MTRLTHFLTHNNLVPITLSVVLLGAGSTYASQNPERIYATVSQVVAIDNTYLVNTDLDTYTPTARITDVTEDDDAFYVTYDLSTIALVDAVWQDSTKTRTLTVYKETLADHRDLGAFVTTQLRDVIERELTQLQKTQGYERQQVSQKQIATTYSGLVGTFMDDTTETLPPYTKEEEPDPVPPPSNSPATTEQDEPAEEESEPRNTPPSIALLGESTITVAIGESYTDLGVHVMDREDEVVDTTITVDGDAVENVSLDTSRAATYQIVYTAVDQDSATASVTRTVVVEDEMTTSGGSGSTTSPDEDTGTTTEEATTSTTTSTNTEQVDAASTTDAAASSSDEAATTTGPDPVTNTSTTTDTDTASTTDASGGNDAASTSTPSDETQASTTTSSNEAENGNSTADKESDTDTDFATSTTDSEDTDADTVGSEEVSTEETAGATTTPDTGSSAADAADTSDTATTDTDSDTSTSEDTTNASADSENSGSTVDVNEAEQLTPSEGSATTTSS